MSIFRKPKNEARVTAVIETARAYIGERSRVNRVNQFGASLGLDGQPWDGSFLEVVMRQADERQLPHLSDTASALAVFTRKGQISVSPQPGDLVFFGFSTAGAFGQPHIGLVTDVSRWKTDGAFRAVEGMVNSGLPRGPQEYDGVYERTRYAVDVLAYARPVYGDTEIPEEPESGVPTVRPAQFQPGKTNKAVIQLQTALHEVNGAVGMTRGKFDTPTRQAVAQFQRSIGYVGERANGTVDATTLRRLGISTSYKYFRVHPEAV